MYNSVNTSEYTITADDGAELAVFESGPADARTIVLCHGILVNHYFWNKLVAAITPEYRVIAYDQRGHGISGARNGENCTVEQLGKDLSTVLHKTDNGKPKIIIGHSMGGMTIGAWVSLFPQEVAEYAAAIVLCQTGFHDVITGNKFVGFRLPNWWICRKLYWTANVAIRFNAASMYYFVQRLHFSGPAPKHEVQEVIDQLVAASEKSVNKLGASLLALDFRKDIKNFVVPTTVIVSDTDNLVHKDLGISIAKSLEKDGHLRKLVEITDCGHAVLNKQPEQFIAAIEEAIAEGFA